MKPLRFSKPGADDEHAWKNVFAIFVIYVIIAGFDVNDDNDIIVVD